MICIDSGASFKCRPILDSVLVAGEILVESSGLMEEGLLCEVGPRKADKQADLDLLDHFTS